MPKKKGSKKGKKNDEAALLRRQQEEAAAAEEQRLYEEAIKAREQHIAASEAALQKRDDDVGAREAELSQKFEALDAEVVLRARSGVAAAEAREAACQKLGAMREERAMQRLASFADAETALAVREMRVAARERALEAKLNDTVAGHMDNMVAAQGDKREKLDALKREVAVAEDLLRRQKDALKDRVTKARAVLAQKNSEAKKRVAVAERKLIEKEFARKRRMARSVTEIEAFLETQREKVVAREGQVASREEAIARRGEAVEQLVREARAHDIDVPKNDVEKRSDGDIVSFVADLHALKGQDTLLLSDSLVLSRKALSLGVPLVEQLWQRLTPRADAESSPAARRLADDAKRVASNLMYSAVRPMGLTAAGGAERCRLEVRAECLATFVDPATGEPRVACYCRGGVKIYDPVAGGAALVVIDVDSHVEALAVFKDPATGEPRLACGCQDKKVRIYDPVAGGEALLVIDVGSNVYSLAVFTDPATGAPRLACGTSKNDSATDSWIYDVRVFDPVAGGEALVVLKMDDEVDALAAFKDPATGAPRLACASEKKVLVFDPVVGGDALLVLDIGSYVNALAVFKEPATSTPRLACSSDDGKVRIFDAVSGGNALLMLRVGSPVKGLVVFKDLATGASRLASGSRDKKVRVFDPFAGGEALVVLEGHTGLVTALTAFTDPATGESRLVSGSMGYNNDVRVWNPAAGSAAIKDKPEGHSGGVHALLTFVDPATGALRVATGSLDKTVRVWDAVTGGALLVIGVGKRVNALAFFVDPATGAPRLACGCDEGVRVFDAVAGGEALLELHVRAGALEVFTDPATGAQRLACGVNIADSDSDSDSDSGPSGEVRVFDPVAGGEALVVIDVGSKVWALAVFADPATGELRIACGCQDGKVRIFDPVAGGEALVVLEGGGSSLVVFTDPATGGLRLASGSDDKSVRIWDLVAGGATLFVLEGHTGYVYALTAFADPATGETRLASGSYDKTLRVWDANKGGAALRVVSFDDAVRTLTVGRDTSRLFVASGKRWGELRVESGTTPLTLACYKGDVAAITALLQRGAGVDQRDDDGYTPLFVASSKGHVDAARLLLDAGAAVDKRREGDWSPFGIACTRGHVDVATLLVERGADTAAVNTCSGGTPPLLFACRARNLGAMQLCLEHGADPNWANEEGETVLYDACKNGHVGAARLLLERGAEINQETENDETPLFIACQKGYVDAARLLLEKGAEVDRTHKRGRTPLYAACENGHVDAARLLLDKGAEGDTREALGFRILAKTIRGGHGECALALLEAVSSKSSATDGESELLSELLRASPNLMTWDMDRWRTFEAATARMQSRSGRAVLRRVRGLPKDSLVSSDHRCVFPDRFNTVCAESARVPCGARGYFEVEIERCVGVVQLGWVGVVEAIDEKTGKGVGDDETSWGVDGIRVQKWHGGDHPYEIALKWRDGDIICCAADLATGDLLFALNGDWDGPDVRAFSGIDIPTDGLAPACTASRDFTCVFNLGDRPWRYAPPPGYRGAHEIWLERKAGLQTAPAPAPAAAAEAPAPAAPGLEPCL